MRLIKFLSCIAVIASLCACNGASTDASDGIVVVNDNAFVENRGADKDNWWDALPREAWAQYERVPQSQEWFEVYRIAEGVHAIYEPGQFEEVISFLITGEERALLFDSGLGIGDMRGVVTALTNLDVIVLNSHTHYDHIGGNHQFDVVYGADTHYSRQSEAGGSHQQVAEFVGPGWVWKPFPTGFEPGAYRSMPYTVSQRVADGQVIDLGGRRLEVLLTPGHAPDALCLIDRDNRLLLTGDTFYLAPLYTHLEGSDFSKYAQSARRLADLAGDVDLLLTAHNVPVASSHYLNELGNAFATIESGRGEYSLADGHREYAFSDFSVIVADDELN